MSGLHRICCCGAPPSCDDCTGCDFGTSYTVSNIQGQISWDKSNKGALCQECSGYDGASNLTEYTVSLTLTQGTWSALTRQATEGSGCCYVASGVINVSYSIIITRSARCCQQDPPVTLSITDTFSGTRATTACLSVIAICDLETGQCSWEHVIRICGFPIANVQIMEQISDEDCAAGLEIGEEPLSRFGMRISGACYTWRSPYLAPNLILTQQMAEQGWGCSGDGCGGCDPITGNSTIPDGPFSLVLGTEWIDTPDPCENYISGIVGSWTDCGGNLIKGAQPWLNFENETDCCYNQASSGFGPPDYA